MADFSDLTQMNEAAIQEQKPTIPLGLKQTLPDEPAPTEMVPEATVPSFGAEKAALNARQANIYPEEATAGQVSQAVDGASIVKGYYSQLGKKTPAERAEIGAKFGMATGVTLGGPVGAVIGAGIGAMTARGIGLVQSGEAEDQKRNERMTQALSAMSITGEDGAIDFGKLLGRSIPVTTDPSLRLPNISPIGNKGKDRSIYELDKTNPFTTRAVSTARPLAYMLTQGILGYNKSDDQRDKTSLNNATNMLTNALITDADSIDLVYERARVLAAKMGLTEDQVKGFFSANKDKIDAVDAANISAGISAIYGSKR
jgi:hypothetical protein